ncbi:MAG: sensor histidine kinase [Rhodobacteraceae bacterium]|nr:sensor histidine kinase [Paracoccaceae bacterium]
MTLALTDEIADRFFHDLLTSARNVRLLAGWVQEGIPKSMAALPDIRQNLIDLDAQAGLLDRTLRRTALWNGMTRKLSGTTDLKGALIRALSEHDLISHMPHLPVRSVALACPDERLQLILAEMLDNARIHAGGLSELRVLIDADRAVIVISDEGPGLERAEFDKASEPFVRLCVARSCGLGLPLVIRAVACQGGEVWREAPRRDQHGLTLAISLPLVPEAAA